MCVYVAWVGLSLQCMCVNESFCVTGSDDGYVRLWPLDFKHVLLEAQHDGPVTAVDISMDCLRVLAATCTVRLRHTILAECILYICTHTHTHKVVSSYTNISHHWRTRTMRCLMANVLQTKVDAHCDKRTTELSWQRLRWSTFSSYSELFVKSCQF